MLANDTNLTPIETQPKPNFCLLFIQKALKFLVPSEQIMNSPKSLSIKIGMICCAIFAYSSVHAESSIHCSKARLPDEKAICRSVELQKQDVKMSTLFEVSGHLMAMGGRGAMQDQQIEWLSTRHQCKRNISCLRQSYAKRIDELNRGLEGIYQRGPF